MTSDARMTLQAASALMEECRRRMHQVLVARTDRAMGLAYAEALHALTNAEAKVESVLREDEEEAA